MKKSILAIIYLFLIASIGYCQETKQSLELTIASDKQVYTVGDEINIEANIRNMGKDEARIYSPDYWGVSDVVVINSKGVPMKPSGVKAERTSFDQLAIIPQGESHATTFRNLRWFHCGGAWEFEKEAQLAPDIYKIYVMITNPPRCVGAKYQMTNLSGTITSNTITIQVIAKKLSKEEEAKY